MKGETEELAKAEERRAPAGEWRRRRWASRRLAELYRLARHRRKYGVEMHEAAWAGALAATLTAASRGPYMVARGKVNTWPGLDIQELADAMRKSGFGSLSMEDLAGEPGNCLGLVINKIERAKSGARYREARGDGLGRLIGLTSEERILCRIRSIFAIDETSEERKARNAETKRERDRKRQREKRHGTCLSRERYEAGSVNRSRPWEAEGISRATYFRRKTKPSGQRDEIMATHLSHAAKEVRSTMATDLSHGSSVGETSPSLHPLRSNEGSGDKPVSRTPAAATIADDIAAAIECFHTPLF